MSTTTVAERATPKPAKRTSEPRGANAAKRQPAATKPPPEPPSPNDLAEGIRAAVERQPGIALASLMKAISVPKVFEPVAASVVDDLVTAARIHVYAKGKTKQFFAADPIATLDRTVPRALKGRGPMDPSELAAACAQEAPGHGPLVPEWIKSAVNRTVLFEYPAAAPRGKKRYALTPDLRKVFDKTLKALKADLNQPAARSVPREALEALLRSEIGVGSGRSDGDQVLESLRQVAAQSPPGALLLARHVRDRTPLEKSRFDAAAMALFRARAVVLHHHDHPKAISEAERSTLIFDGADTYYVGIAPSELQ